MKIYNSYDGGPVNNDIELGSNSLKTTDLLIKQGDSNTIHIKNIADTAYRNLGIDALSFNSFITAGIDALYIGAKNVDNNYLYFRARNTGTSYDEIARLQGAADPYFQTTVPMVMLPVPTASLPATPVEGMVHYDATLNKLVVYTGAAWETVTSV